MRMMFDMLGFLPWQVYAIGAGFFALIFATVFYLERPK
jgi:hypothetical protein